MAIKPQFSFILLLSFCFRFALSQDTLTLSVLQADSIFLKNSYYLLASAMNIEAQKAMIIQAKLYPNPIFTGEINAIDPQNEKTFHVGQSGEKNFQLEQLILLGGKKKLEIEMAKTNAGIAELEFQRLVQNLKFQLHSSLISVGQQEFLLEKYNQHLVLLDSLLSAYQAQVDKGNIALKELVRLKGAYLNLNNERAQLLNDYFNTQAIIQKITQISSTIHFESTEGDISRYIKPVLLEELNATASESRPDLLLIKSNNLLAQQFLQYQKKLAIPDINVFTAYDQRGGAFINQVNTGLALPLPVWNRNQGAVASARYRVQEANYQLLAMQNDVNREIQNAYSHYTQTVTEYQKARTIYNQDFETTFQGMTDNFRKRNVSIIEFIDFFESYTSVLTEIARIKTQLVYSAEQLNLLVGKELY